MKKVKVFLLGAAIFGLGTFGISYLGAIEAEAQSAGIAQCTWNGRDCFDPITYNMCGCEQGEADQ